MKNILYPLLITIVLVIGTFVFFGGLENYFTSTLDNLVHHPREYAVASCIILASDILLPVPSSILMYINGYVLGPYAGALLSLVSLMAGSTVGFYLGQLTSFGLKAKTEEGPDSILSRYGALAIVMTRGIPVLSESICIVCGYNRMRFRKYFLFNFIGYVPLCLLYSFCGSVGYDRNTFLISFICSLFISFLFWLFGRLFFPKRDGAFKTITTQSKPKSIK